MQFWGTFSCLYQWQHFLTSFWLCVEAKVWKSLDYFFGGGGVPNFETSGVSGTWTFEKVYEVEKIPTKKNWTTKSSNRRFFGNTMSENSIGEIKTHSLYFCLPVIGNDVASWPSSFFSNPKPCTNYQSSREIIKGNVFDTCMYRRLKLENFSLTYLIKLEYFWVIQSWSNFVQFVQSRH